MESPNDENKLLKGLLKGDIIAFEYLYKKHNKRIYAFSLRYLRNKEDAEGVAQEVFLKLWENCKKLHKNSNLNAWIYTVTFNAIKKRFRKLSTEKRHLENHSASIESGREEISEVEYHDMLEKATQLIEKLPPQQKRVFLLRIERELSCDEMAEKLNISKKTAENHLNRARLYIKKEMIKKGLL